MPTRAEIHPNVTGVPDSTVRTLRASRATQSRTANEKLVEYHLSRNRDPRVPTFFKKFRIPLFERDEFDNLQYYYAGLPEYAPRPIRRVYGASGECIGIEMEKIPGRTLGECILAGDVPHNTSKALLRFVSESERAGVYHGDENSENIMVLPDGNIKLVDFEYADPIAAGLHKAHIEKMARVAKVANERRDEIRALHGIVVETLTGVRQAAEEEQGKLFVERMIAEIKSNRKLAKLIHSRYLADPEDAGTFYSTVLGISVTSTAKEFGLKSKDLGSSITPILSGITN